MFLDAKYVPHQQNIHADLCIIGAGAAGITMAMELNGTGIKIALLESGGMAYDERTQALYHGTNIGRPSFDVHVNRLRYFGGTTNHWAGHCRPLDDIDFSQRGWVAHSGWPLDRQSLNPYYARAQPMVGLGPDQYESLDFFTHKLKLPALALDERRLKTVVYNQSPPTRFGVEYRKTLANSENITVYLNANVLALARKSHSEKIEAAEVACIDGPRFTLRAKIFVVATGGMENARLLMLSQRANPRGLGINHELVGKYFMDHILLRPGADISFSRADTNFDLYRRIHRIAGGKMFAVMAASNALMKAEKLPNFRIHLVSAPPYYDRPIGRISAKLDRSNKAYDDATQAADFGSIALHLVLEPEPNPLSSIDLNDEKLDVFGQPSIRVNWQLVESDLHNAHRALELAALEFGRLGLGRSFGKIYRDKTQWPDNLEAGRHHCGTTRMAESIEKGVVDHHCRVHGLQNLYLAGSSVFPTIGYANPTLTIIALALRLSDNLKSDLSSA